MFKSWSKKHKIKVVFKLQFQATQVPKLKKSALMVSLVPDDVGKPTVRLEKAAIQDGTCFWENPVYETVKLVRDTKTAKINEKIYHFVVSTGSSKSGFVGEASIDFADFEAQTEPMTVSLPLKFANSGAVLHVTIQKMEGDNDQRDVEENGASTLQHDNSFNSQLSYSSAENGDLNTLHEDAEQNGSSRASLVSNSAKFASYWDGNYDQNTGRDPGYKNSAGPSPTTLPLRQNTMPKNTIVDTTRVKNHAHRRSNTEWSLGSVSDGSFGDSTNGLEENTSREKIHAAPNESLEKLKNENFMLMRKLEATELELQSLRKQVTKETIQGQNLSRQIISLTEERDVLKTECKQLKFLKKCNEEADESKTLKSEIKEARIQLAAVGEELKQEKELRTDLQLQLQKTQESNSDLVLAVRDLEEMIELKNRVIADLSRTIESWESDRVHKDVYNCEEGDNNENQKPRKELIPEYDDVKEVHLLKQEIKDLHSEVDIHKKDIEELEMHLERVMVDNEILKQENDIISAKLEKNKAEDLIKQNEYSGSQVVVKELESQVERLEEKIRMQTEEFSESLIFINELEGQIKGLEREREKQRREFIDELNAMKCTKIKLEKMAIEAKEVLSKTRWKSAVKSVCLQEKSKRLSLAMASKINDNEKTTVKAVKEINELHQQKKVIEEMLQKSHEESKRVREQSEVKLQELSYQLELKTKDIHHMTMELDNKYRQLEDARKRDEYIQEEIQMLRSNIETLTAEKHFAKQAEGEQPDLLTYEIESLEERSREREILEKEIAFTKREAEMAHQELIRIKSSKDQQDTLIANLLAEVENHRAQINGLKKESQREDFVNRNLKEQVFLVKSELQNKEVVTSSMENTKLKSQETAVLNINSTSICTTSPTNPHNQDELTTSDETIQLLEVTNHPSVSVRSTGKLIEGNVTGNPLHSKSRNKEEITSQEDFHVALPGRKLENNSSIKAPKFSTTDESNGNCGINLLAEMSSLKERNKAMERELKEMEERYSEISLKFAEVEGERQQLVMTVRNLKNSKRY